MNPESGSLSDVNDLTFGSPSSEHDGIDGYSSWVLPIRVHHWTLSRRRAEPRVGMRRRFSGSLRPLGISGPAVDLDALLGRRHSLPPESAVGSLGDVGEESV